MCFVFSFWRRVMPASFSPQQDSQLGFYGSLSHQRTPLTLFLHTGVEVNPTRPLYSLIISFYFRLCLCKNVQSQALPAKKWCPVTWSPPEHQCPSSVNLKGRKRLWVQLNQKYQMWKSAISNYRLALIGFCFFLSLFHRLSCKHTNPHTEIYLHHRCFYLSPTNFSLNSASMYNAFEGDWIGFFFFLLPLFLVLYTAA